MSKEEGFSEENLRKIAEQKINFRLSVKIHLAVFVLVNLLLIGINFLFAPSYIWALFPLFGWFIGLLAHIISYIMYARGVYPMAKRGLIYHVAVYASVMLLLVLIDLQVMMMTVSPISWSLYPLIFWGAGVAVHIAVYKIYLSGSIEGGEAKSKKEQAIEKEMNKIRNKN